MDGHETLYDFGMEIQEPCLWGLKLGQVELVYDDWSECGAWRYWVVCNYFDEYFYDEDDDIHIYHPVWHICKDGNTEGCICDELNLDRAYYKEDWTLSVEGPAPISFTDRRARSAEVPSKRESYIRDDATWTSLVPPEVKLCS